MEQQTLVPLLVGLLILFIGLVEAFAPQMTVRFQIWIQKVVLGAQYIPSARTYTFIRFMGFFFILLGIFIMSSGFLK